LPSNDEPLTIGLSEKGVTHDRTEAQREAQQFRQGAEASAIAERRRSEEVSRCADIRKLPEILSLILLLNAHAN
jgi:hypothetical protein